MTCSCRCRGPRQAAYRELDCWLDWSYRRVPGARPSTSSEDDDYDAFRHRDHRNRFGQHDSRRALCRQDASPSASRACSAAPASTSAASRPRCSSTPRTCRTTVPRPPPRFGLRRPARRGAVERHRVAGVRPDRPARARRRELPAILAQRHGVRQSHPVRPEPARRPVRAAHRRRRRVHRRSGGDRRRLPRAWYRRRSPTAACRYHTSDTIMRIPDLPEHLVIVGGGFVAAEFAHIFSALGTQVTLVIRGSTLLPHCDDTICAVHRHRRQEMGDPQPPQRGRRSLRRRRGHAGSRRRLHAARPTRCWSPPAEYPTATCSTPNWPESKVDATAGSHVDEYQRTTARGIFALGDVCSAYQLKHVANHEARVVRAQPAGRLGRHRRADAGRPPLRAVGGVHRPADRLRRTDRKRGPSTGLPDQGQGPGLQRRRLRLGDGGHHRHREGHRRRRDRADPGRAHHGPSGLLDRSSR